MPHSARPISFGITTPTSCFFRKWIAVCRTTVNVWGDATLSRLPLGRQRNIDLTHGGRIRHGAQHARIDLRNGDDQMCIDVFNVHLCLTARLRRRQIRHLLATVDMARLTTDALCIIGGDMNDWRGELNRVFRPAGFQCATNRRPGSRWTIKTFPRFAPTSSLDKIFYRGPLHLRHIFHRRLKLERVANDHLSVICEFDAENTNGARK